MCHFKSRYVTLSHIVTVRAHRKLSQFEIGPPSVSPLTLFKITKQERRRVQYGSGVIGLFEIIVSISRHIFAFKCSGPSVYDIETNVDLGDLLYIIPFKTVLSI